MVVFSSCLLLCTSISPFVLSPDADFETFSYGVSQFHVDPAVTYTLWSTKGSGVIQYFWLTGDFDVSDMIFDVYLDGGAQPNYTFTPDELAGIGFGDQASPWGNSVMGKGALWGGVYSQLKVPFSDGIVYKTRMAPGATKGGTLFWQIRGTPALPIVVGNVQLPATAKLVLYRNAQVTLKPLEFLTLANTTNAGVVFMTLLAVKSSNLNYLEGCFRTYIKGAADANLISTGSEDYFQSGYYFNAGAYHFPGAGLSHRDDATGTLSAYKIHEDDPLFFSRGGFQFVWRNGDTQDPTSGHKCANDKGPTVGNPQQSVVTTYCWVYEW